MSVLCDEFMDLKLAALPRLQLKGIYSDSGFPARMSFVHPDCYQPLMNAVRGCGLVFTDIWRSASVSLNRKYPPGKLPRMGAQKPAWSAHNYGFAVDIDVQRTMKEGQWDSKEELDDAMAAHGLYCHRTDHKLRSESWHYNILTVGGADWLQNRRPSVAVEQMIRGVYSEYWALTSKQIQRCLKVLSLYIGEIDGDLGPMSKAAIRQFQKAWHLKVDGDAGPMTCRLLSFRCAELRHASLKNLWTVK